MADKTNSGVTAFVAEITSMCGLRWDGIAAVNSLDYRMQAAYRQHTNCAQYYHVFTDRIRRRQQQDKLGCAHAWKMDVLNRVQIK